MLLHFTAWNTNGRLKILFCCTKIYKVISYQFSCFSDSIKYKIQQKGQREVGENEIKCQRLFYKRFSSFIRMDSGRKFNEFSTLIRKSIFQNEMNLNERSESGSD